MSTQDNLNNANELGRTIAALVSQPDIHLNANNTKVVDNLVAALAAKAHELLNPPAIKNEIVMGAGDTAQIHGNGDVVIEVAVAFPQTISGPLGFTSENLHRYLNREYGEGKIDHVVRVVTTNLHESEFYIRPLNADGETAQFAVTRI